MEYPITNEIYSRLLGNIGDDLGQTLPGIMYWYFYIYSDLTKLNMDNYSALIRIILINIMNIATSQKLEFLNNLYCVYRFGQTWATIVL